MRLRVLLLPLLLLSPLALAAEPTGTTLPWELLDCRYAYASAPIPAARLAPFLPPGWTPYAVVKTGSGPMAFVVFEVDDCAEGSGIEGRLAPMQYASTWTYAIPPIGMRTDAPLTVFTWEVLVPDAPRRELLQGVGAPAHDGHVRFLDPVAEGAPFRVEHAFGDVAFSMQIAPSPVAPADVLRTLNGANAGGEFDQWVRGSDGSYTYWRTFWTVDEPHAGAAVVNLDPASWQARAFGTTRVAAQAAYGTWDYHDGKIVLPS